MDRIDVPSTALQKRRIGGEDAVRYIRSVCGWLESGVNIFFTVLNDLYIDGESLVFCYG